jgi:hypothetical protein
MTGHIAARNFWSLSGGATQTILARSNKSGNEPGLQWSFESSQIHLPVMTAGHRVATRNSCTELVMPVEKHQPQRKEHLDDLSTGRSSVTGRAAGSVAAYWPHRL